MTDNSKIIAELRSAMAEVERLPDKNALLNSEMAEPERSEVEAAFKRLEAAEAAWREAGSPAES